jgi:membrane protein DedA with SNARE-associated domain
MHLFTDYIQPLTFWLFDHPHWALFITFLISFSESLAIVGSIIPGSVTMTAIGILAGSGVMRIDLTFLAATLGAIAGDSGSYALGYTFSDRLINVWPFRNYPKWIKYGQDYFARHGSSSILIGRFVGPMRSIIPVIAGMMHMNHWHFLAANVISGIAWAILYVTPGVLIGVASSELSTESATRLFVLILILLIVVWVSSLAIKWLLIHTNQFLRTRLHNTWNRLKRNPRMAYYARKLAPDGEINHYPTAALIVLFMLCFVLSLISITFVVQANWIATLNTPIYLFFQSLRTQAFDSFFVVISLITSPLPLLTLIASIAIYALYYRDWRSLRYWVSLCLTSSALIFLLTHFIDIPKLHGIAKHPASPLFPDVNLTFATTLFGFFVFYIRTHSYIFIMLTLRVLLLTTLFLSGVSLLYLGDNWFSSVLASYFIGLTICLLHWIFYRRNNRKQKQSQVAIIFICILLAIAAYISNFIYFKTLLRAHSQQLAQYVITNDVWWNQQQPLLPIYSTNRIGQRTGLLNVQYVGSIETLQEALEASGWKQRRDSFFYSLLIRAGGQNPAEDLPLMAKLYQNNKPNLVMTFNPNNKQILILRLWRSNYHLKNYRDPIWIGSINPIIKTQRTSPVKSVQQLYQSIASQNYIMQALHGFEFNRINLPKQYLQLLPQPTSSVLLIIKDPALSSKPKSESDN